MRPPNSSQLSRHGIAIPHQDGSGAYGTPGDLRHYCRRAEALGFRGLWVNEMASAPNLDPLLLLSHIGACTVRVKLGVAVLLVPLRSPLQLAREIASVDQLCSGRLILGVGFGRNIKLYKAHGLSAERRLKRYIDALDLLESLWAGEPVTYANEWWDLDEALVLRPQQSPRPPVWFGARWGPALRRAVERGDGWIISGSAPPEEYRSALEEVKRHLDELGRDPTSFTIAKRVYIIVTDDENSSRRRMSDWFAANYGNRDLSDEVAIIGNAEHCVAELRSLCDAGVNELILNPVFDVDEQLETLGAKILPHL